MIQLKLEKNLFLLFIYSIYLFIFFVEPNQWKRWFLFGTASSIAGCMHSTCLEKLWIYFDIILYADIYHFFFFLQHLKMLSTGFDETVCAGKHYVEEEVIYFYWRSRQIKSW